jgi:hypothetical protein
MPGIEERASGTRRRGGMQAAMEWWRGEGYRQLQSQRARAELDRERGGRGGFPPGLDSVRARARDLGITLREGHSHG